MCRALLYLGEPVLLDHFLYQPDSALVRQTYMPKMLNMLNLAGFGLRAWDPASHDPEPKPEEPRREDPRRLPARSRARRRLRDRGGDLAAELPPVPLPRRAARPRAQRRARAVCRAEAPALALHQAAASFPDPRHHRQRVDPHRHPSADELAKAVERTVDIMRGAREKLGIAISSSLNLFIADGTQLAAVRYCFDYGCYPTDDASRLREVDLSYLSLWYTAGRDYGLHDGEWRMTGGSENATSILVASEPLTRDTAAWVEVPEYSILHATIKDGRPVMVSRDIA
jgi:predicted glutamine amidotransferase